MTMSGADEEKRLHSQNTSEEHSRSSIDAVNLGERGTWPHRVTVGMGSVPLFFTGLPGVFSALCYLPCCSQL